MDCHIQIFNRGAWVDAATITDQRTGRGGVNSTTLFEYDIEYVFDSGVAPVSLRFPVSAENLTLSNWPAFLYDLIPQGNGRAYLLGELGLPDDKTADFQLLCAGAFNPIGRIRVREAVDYLANHIRRHDTSGFEKGATLEEILRRDHSFVERMMVQGMLAAGTTGVQVAAPKFLLTKAKDGLWYVDGQVPDAMAHKHYIVKLPRGKDVVDKKVLRNEAAYMRVAKAMGIHVADLPEHHEDMLFIPRFDRHVVGGQVIRLHQESAASIAGVAGFDRRPTQFEILRGLRDVCADRTGVTIEFLKRDILNLAMRNTDNHARNTAVQVVDGVARLTPLFDFAPMYLDKEGISRAARWYHPETRVEITSWREVIDCIPLEQGERVALYEALRQFGGKMLALNDCMRECGVDDDIILHLQAGIQTQVAQLRELHQSGIDLQIDGEGEAEWTSEKNA
jgi:serine/threonine-protein kinase HipA